MVAGGIESLGLFVVSLLFFVALGIRQNALVATDDHFWLAGKDLTANELSATWSAGSLSLGLTILYYMAMTAVFGWKIFLISIFTYLLGQLVFSYVASQWRLKYPEMTATVEEVVSAGTNKLALIRLAQYSGLFSLMAMLYAELFFSSQIINSILGSSSPSWAPTLLFITSLLIVTLYVLFGGMRAIVESDRWQLYLLYGAVATLLILAMILMASGVKPKFESSLPWLEFNLSKVDTISYFIFGLAANILPLLCQNSLWQMASSTEPGSILSGARRGILRAFITFTIVIFIAFVINGRGEPVSTNLLVNSMISLGDFGSHFLLPIMFVGFLAAMLSTADNLLLGSALTIKHLLGGSRLNPLKSLSVVKERLLLVSSVAVIEVIAFVTVTHILEKTFASYFLSLVFFLFSQAAPFGLIILLAALYPNRLRQSGIMVLGVAIAWLLDFSAFVYASSSGLQKVQFVATPLAILITFLFAFRFNAASNIQPGDSHE